MEILFGNKGIYHYMDAKVGTMQELEEYGRMYQVRMLVENEYLDGIKAQKLNPVWLNPVLENAIKLNGDLEALPAFDYFL